VWRAAAGVIVVLVLAACAEYLGTSFSEIAPPEIAGLELRAGAQCNLETVNGARPGAPWQLSRQYRVQFAGWALDAASLSSTDWLVVRLTRAGGGARYYAATWARTLRDDVARELGTGAASTRSGFELIATLQQVAPGPYDIDVIVGTPTGPVWCPTGRQLVAL